MGSEPTHPMNDDHPVPPRMLAPPMWTLHRQPTVRWIGSAGRQQPGAAHPPASARPAWDRGGDDRLMDPHAPAASPLEEPHDRRAAQLPAAARQAAPDRRTARLPRLGSALLPRWGRAPGPPP